MIKQHDMFGARIDELTHTAQELKLNDDCNRFISLSFYPICPNPGNMPGATWQCWFDEWAIDEMTHNTNYVGQFLGCVEAVSIEKCFDLLEEKLIEYAKTISFTAPDAPKEIQAHGCVYVRK
jgi:hypothetical protein